MLSLSASGLLEPCEYILERRMEDALAMRDGPLGVDCGLYSGIAGISLAVWNHHRRMGGAGRNGSELASILGDGERYPNGGWLDGLAGAIYVLANLSRDNASVASSLESVVVKNMTKLLSVSANELGGGTAGVLIALGHAWQVTRSKLIEYVCEVLLLDLMNGAQKMPQGGIIWDAHPYQVAPLLSFAHGNSGVAYAFKAVVGKYRDCPVFDQLVGCVRRFEDQGYLRSIKGWPDFRELGGGHTWSYGDSIVSMDAWCHGGPGILMGRLFPYAERAMIFPCKGQFQSTSNWYSGSPSLCHGDIGNALIEKAIRLVLDDGDAWEPTFEMEVSDWYERAADAVRKHIGIAGSDYSSGGLFLGLAGGLHFTNCFGHMANADGVVAPFGLDEGIPLGVFELVENISFGEGGCPSYEDHAGREINIDAAILELIPRIVAELDSQEKRTIVELMERRFVRDRSTARAKVFLATLNRAGIRRLYASQQSELSDDVLDNVWLSLSPFACADGGVVGALTWYCFDGEKIRCLEKSDLLQAVVDALPCSAQRLKTILRSSNLRNAASLDGDKFVLKLIGIGLVCTATFTSRFEQQCTELAARIITEGANLDERDRKDFA